MSSISARQANRIRKDESIKSGAKVTKNVDQTNANKKSVTRSPNFNKIIVNKVNLNDKNKGNGAKQGLDVESRASLQQKVRHLEEELEKYEFERNRITEELDRVCEEKDNQIRQLKTSLHEKQTEIDHQIYTFRKSRNDFEEELNRQKYEIEGMRIEFKNKESILMEKNESLEKELLDLNDYIKNRDHTLDKIRQLEEINKQQNISHKRIKEKLVNEVENEKLKVEELVTTRVNEMKRCLETSCLNKLSIDARIALEKFEEMSKNYEMSEDECRHLRRDNERLKARLREQRMYLEVSESLLHEMLKELNRKIYYRKDADIQTEINSLDKRH